MVTRYLLTLALLCNLVIFPGCGSSGPAKVVPAGVQGLVTLGGKGLEEGTVNFSSAATGNGAIAKIGAEGKFVVTGGVVPGDYKVTITPPTPTPDNPKPKASKIPKKYRDLKTSDLTAKITSSSNDLKFELTE